MKIKIHSIICSSLILLLVLGLFQPVEAKSKVHTNSEASDIATEITKMYNESKTTIYSVFMDRPKESEKDNYAGMYIDENNIVNLNVVSVNSNLVSEIEEKYNNNVKVNVVDNAYSNLKKIYDNINELVIKYGPKENISVKIDEIGNKVAVESNVEFSESFLNEYLSNNINLVTFKKTNVVIESEIDAGSDFNNNCTVGYKAFRNGKQGFVTAGHCFLGANEIYVDNASDRRYAYQGSIRIGTLVAAKTFHGIDAAFVETHQTMSNYASASGVTSFYHTGGDSSEIKIGKTISMYGSRSGYQVGVITHTNKSFYISHGGEQMYMVDQFEYTIRSTGGDSGSILLAVVNGKTVAIGVHNSGPSAYSGQYAPGRHGSKANNISSNLNLNN